MLRRQYHCRDIFSGWVDLAYDSIHPLELSLQRYINTKKNSSFFYIVMSSYILSNISQNNIKMLKEQQQEM